MTDDIYCITETDIDINDGDPQRYGVYVTYVNGPSPKCADRKLLFWNGRWSYIGSDQNYRGTVYGWIGPIPPMELF